MTGRRYPQELRERAVRMVFEHRTEPSSQWAAITAIAPKVGVGPAPGQRDPQVRSGFLRGGARPPTQTMTAYIDANKDTYGFEPIFEVLPIAPSTY
jgi:transposase-like protein